MQFSFDIHIYSIRNVRFELYWVVYFCARAARIDSQMWRLGRGDEGEASRDWTDHRAGGLGLEQSTSVSSATTKTRVTRLAKPGSVLREAREEGLRAERCACGWSRRGLDSLTK